MYVPGIDTVVEAEVELLLHNNEPVNPEAVNTELPQLSLTVTVGVAGTGFGATTPFPSELIQPFTD